MSIQQKTDKVIRWLRDKVSETSSRGLLVGLSGGVDSAVVAALIQKAMPENSLGIILPIRSNPQDIDHAELLIDKVGIQSMSIDLTGLHEALLDEVYRQLESKGLLKEQYKKITDANLRARLRMSTLYALANNLGYLVVGTDNAAEIYTGYFTKYGDGGVDLLPLAHLLKREVYDWAKYFDLPREILEKAPSAGLWEGQTDEAEMGTSYRYIDDLISGLAIPSADRETIEKLHAKSEHKRMTAAMPPRF